MIAQKDSPIFLVGFMGAGKTTVGEALARLLDFDFFDLDRLIEARAGKTVARIFSDLGEPEFRRLERKAIHSFRDQRRAVIALGGGAYVAEENRSVLRAIGKTVWLDCPLEICLRRISDDKSRPLLGDYDQMRTLLAQRRVSYEKADYVIGSGELTPEELAQTISRLLRQ
ncbi:MAG TPA: shikimate kinase [Blastocatellia bacterium]|nr:shikimate kinase [Blastocatellia bacterium]